MDAPRRRFLVVFHRARTAPDFRLEDLPASGGRFDLVCRTVASAFLVSHGVRHDTDLTLVLLGGPKPPLALRLSGDTLRHLHPDERSMAAWLSRFLSAPSAPGAWIPAGDGASVARMGFGEALEDSGAPEVVALDETGAPASTHELRSEALFVLGDDQGFLPEERELLRKRGARFVSLGRRSLHTEQCVTIVHHRLDEPNETTGRPER